MTLKEAAEALNRSERTIYKNFKRTQDSLLKKGIILTRWGPDDYEIEYEDSDKLSYIEDEKRKQRIAKLEKELEKLKGQGE